ncbi:YncE family protein [Dokdonella ginsengisoli]|uniref:YncE family protein n=1 Tax=Dokdonella ginsengisoli TaxID=363846 RepID=A0ABV9R0Z8_9GAMM
MSCHRPLAAAAGLCLLATLFDPHACAAPASAPQGQDPLTLAVTVSTDLTPGSCGDAQSLEVTAGDPVNFCYTIGNASPDTLAFHTLVDDRNGVLLQDHAQDVAPGESFQYNDVRIVGESQTLLSTWTAATALADYTSAAGDPDRLFGDGFDGGAAPPPYAFEDISATGTDLNLADDGEATVPIGFDFTFYGHSANVVRVGNNGAMLFGVETGEVGYNNLPLPNATLGPAILPFWDDFAATGGGVFAQTLGEAPERRLVVQWNQRVHYVSSGTASDPATFEAILHEGSNEIVFQYADVDMDGEEFDGGLSATIGLNQGARANQYSYNVAAVAAGSAIRFVPTPMTSYVASASVTVTAGSPDIVVDPASLSATVAAGATTQVSLGIGNDGDAELTWSLSEAQAPAARSRAAPPAAAAPSSTTALAPRTLASSLLPANRGGDAPAGAAVPAFGVNLNSIDGNTLVRFDAAAPGSTTPVGAVERTLVGGAFLDGDFGTLYSLDFDSGELVRVNTADAGIAAVGVAATLNGEDWSGLALDPTDGTLYASSTLMSGSLSSTLYTIDPLTGAATPVGAIAGGGRVIEIAADVGGQLYGVDIDGDVLIAIDKASGAATAIGALGFNAEFAEGLDFDPSSNVLYFAAVNDESVFSQPGQMYTLDTATGHATLVGGISADPAAAQIAAFAIALPPSPCAVPADVPWLTLAVTSGSTAAGATTPVDVGFDAGTLDAGSYSATLCVRSNDADQRIVVVPVSLTVQ